MTPKRRDGAGGAHLRDGRSTDAVLKYSFMYLQTDHPAFDVSRQDGSYFRALLARLKDLSSMQPSEFLSSRSKTLRIHPIDFRDPRVAVRSFGIAQALDLDRRAWQFSVSANEHGRVHGFLIEDTFYVRWLDPDHNLYSRS